jgi:predicted DNA-binding antitoxin AbrB/MazE fold protein
MTQQVTAIYDGGVLKPLSPLTLQDKEVVSLVVNSVEPPKPSEAAETAETLYDILSKDGWIGSLKDAPPDLSTNPKYMEGFGESGR